MHFLNNLNESWQAMGEQPHETQGPAPMAPKVPHGTEGFDPLSEGADKAIQQVRKNIGYQKPHFMRPLVEMLGSLGNAQLLGSPHAVNRAAGQEGFNPYAAQDAEMAQNMEIMKYLQEAEQARKLHELKQQQLAEYQHHNREIEKYNSGPNGRKLGKQYAPTNLGKLYKEQDEAIEQYQQDPSEDNLAKVNRYNLAVQKATTDPDTRKRVLFAANLEKTLKMIDTKVVTQYSGPKGALQYKADQALDLIGKPPERYLKYKDAIGVLIPAVGQARQFLNDASAKEAAEKLEHMANPSELGTSPEAAERQLKSSLGVFGNELQTYYGGVTSTKEHTGHGVNSGQSSPVSSMSTDAIREEISRLKRTQ